MPSDGRTFVLPTGCRDVRSGRFGSAREHIWYPPGWGSAYLHFIVGLHDRESIVVQIRSGSCAVVGSSCQLAWRITPDVVQVALDNFLADMAQTEKLPLALLWLRDLPCQTMLPADVLELLRHSVTGA